LVTFQTTIAILNIIYFHLKFAGGSSGGGGNPVMTSSPVGAGGDIGPPPNVPHHPSYQEYPPSPASWLSDVDSNANPQY